jgi:LPXTG-motif cell wall-anchored protein
MISTRMSRRLCGTSAMLAGTIIAVVGLVPSLAAASGGEVGPHGRLIVEKTVEGESAATFGFNVNCNDNIDRNFTLLANTSKAFDGIRTGSVCVVTETDNGGADSTKVIPSDGTVVIGDDVPVTVSVLNVFDPPATTTTTTTTTIAPLAVTTTTAAPIVLGETLTAPIVMPAELPRTGSSAMPTLLTAGLVLTALGIALRRRATRSTILR